MTTSLLFCIGPLTILGSFEYVLMGGSFAPVLGWGFALDEVLDRTEPMIAATDGILILGPRARLVEIEEVRVANMLPALGYTSAQVLRERSFTYGRRGETEVGQRVAR